MCFYSPHLSTNSFIATKKELHPSEAQVEAVTADGESENMSDNMFEKYNIGFVCVHAPDKEDNSEILAANELCKHTQNHRLL